MYIPLWHLRLCILYILCAVWWSVCDPLEHYCIERCQYSEPVTGVELSSTCISALFLLTVARNITRLLAVEVEIILTALVSSRLEPGYIEYHRVAIVRR